MKRMMMAATATSATTPSSMSFIRTRTRRLPRRRPPQKRVHHETNCRRRGRARAVPGATRAPPPEPSLDRSQLVNRDVIARRTGKRLGRIAALSCDPATLSVVSMSVKSGTLLLDTVAPREIALRSLRQLGDVALVDEDLNNPVGGPPNMDAPSSSSSSTVLVDMSVVTEDAEYMGRVRDFKFNPEDGRIQALITDEVGWLPPSVQLPANLVSTYLIDASEVVQVGDDRIIVAAGAQGTARQLSVGLFGQLSPSSPGGQRQRARDPERRRGGWYDEEEDLEEFDVRGRGRLPEPSSVQFPRADAGRPEGIPIVAPPPPYRRRDADGGLGEAPPPSRAKRFDEWVERDDRREGALADGWRRAEPRASAMYSSDDIEDEDRL